MLLPRSKETEAFSRVSESFKIHDQQGSSYPSGKECLRNKYDRGAVQPAELSAQVMTEDAGESS